MSLSLPRYRVRFLHLTAVWAYGVSQPIFALIDGNPDLLVTRDATRASVVLFAVLLAIVPPALITSYTWLAARFSPWIGDRLYIVALGACLVPLVARFVRHLDSGLVLSALLVGALAVAGVVLYARLRAVRLFVGYSIVLPVVSLVWFVNGLPNLTADAEAAAVSVKSPAPVVFIQLDEMSASALMTRDGSIDAVRYPSFARLAREGVWYRNATTVHEWTSDAVPAILSGRLGDTAGIPTLQNHPDNLFTLLGGGGYSLQVHETLTRLCPHAHCPRAERSTFKSGYSLFADSFSLLVPRVFPRSLSERMIPRNSDISMPNSRSAVVQLNARLRESTREPTDQVLFFEHLLLPHAPWRFLPSGVEYDYRHIDGWLPTEHWESEPWLALQGQQRYLLQVGYLDSVIGGVLRALEREGLYERSLVVVVADHGVSFRAGEGRRPLTTNNVADILNIPLFVKYPDGVRTGVDSRAVRSVDILPTIAEVLGVRVPWELDGLSLLGSLPEDRDIVVGRRGQSGLLHTPLDEMIRDREVTLRFQHQQFGEGHDSLFRIGTSKALLGRFTTDEVERSEDVAISIEDEAALSDVRLSSRSLPVRISGHVSSGRLDHGAELAVAVNGRVRGLTTWFLDERDGVQRFRTLVPESSLRDGANRVDVYLVRGGQERARLVLLGSAGLGSS